jgi:MFS family permease
LSTKSQTSVYAIALITAVCLFGDSMLYVALPTHYHQVGISSLVEVGVLLSINRIVRLPLNPVIGLLYRKMPPRQGIVVAVVIAGTTTTLYGIVKSFWLWALIRAVWGLAWSFFKIGAFLLILDLSEDGNRGHLMGRYNGLYRLGSLVGMLGGGFFADQFGIDKVSLVFGFTAFLAVPAAIRYIPATHAGLHKRSDSVSHLQIRWWRDSRVLWVLTTAVLGAMALEGMLTATLSHVLALRHPTVVKCLWISMGASTFAGAMQACRWLLGPWISPWIGRLSDGRWGRTRILAGTLGCAAVLMAMIPMKMPFALWLTLLFLLLLVSTLVSTVSDSVASDTAAVSSAVAVMTTYAMAVDVGAAIGPTLGYGLDAWMGTASMYWVSALVLLFLTTTWMWMARSVQRVDRRRSIPM